MVGRFDSSKDIPDLPETIPELLGAVRSRLVGNDSEGALSIVHRILETEPKNTEAQTLLLVAEKSFIQQMYAAHVSPTSIPKLLVSVDSLTEQQLGPQEGFLLSRINGEWDIGSILSICPFREADSLRMIKKLLDSGIIGL